jgi:GT2 family glycosyltransferase
MPPRPAPDQPLNDNSLPFVLTPKSAAPRMTPPVPVTVGIPTYARGDCVLTPIERVLACDPPPAEIIVHVDASDGGLEKRIHEKFPHVRILSSQNRIGPGGGRDRCLRAASHPYFASFDDDSWPVDDDFFSRVVKHFKTEPKAAGLAAMIYHQNQVRPELTVQTEPSSCFTGCGHAMRVGAYRECDGYVDRSVAYGIEELDISMQLHAAGWLIHKCMDLRVYHDTVLAHHYRSEITAGTIQNASILTYVRYPIVLWPYGLLQYCNLIRFMVLQRRFQGLLAGIFGTPRAVWRHRHLRRPLTVKAVASYLASRTRPSEPFSTKPIQSNDHT